MRIRADNHIPRTGQSVFRDDDVLDAHAFLSLLIVIADALCFCKITHPLTLFGGLDIFIGSKVIRHQHDLIRIEHLAEAVSFKYIDRRRSGDIVSQKEIESRLDQIARGAIILSRVLRQNFLCHRHSHKSYHPSTKNQLI